MRFKLFKETFVVDGARTVITIEVEGSSGDFVDIPYLGSEEYDDYFVIGLYPLEGVLHLVLNKK